MPTAIDPWQEPTVLRLLERSKEQDPVGVIKVYAERCLRDAGASSLPIDVLGIASLLGIRIRIADHPFAGRIYMDPAAGLVMDINARDSEARRRFTCAHEIMHTAFPGFRADGRYRVDRGVGAQERSRGEEEYLCDRGAAELLMPEGFVRGLYDAGRGLGDVERLASAAHVSLEAAAIRLVSLADRPTAFLVLEWGHGPAEVSRLRKGETAEMRLRVRYGIGQRLGARVPRHASAPTDSVFGRALESERAVRGVSELPGSGSARSFMVEAKAYGPGHSGGNRRVLALARPTT